MSKLTHELNNLLTVIQGFTQLAAEKLDDDHPARGDLGEVLDAATQAIDLVRRSGAAQKGLAIREEDEPADPG